MIVKTTFETTCKRISEIVETSSLEFVEVQVSKALIDDFNLKKKKYLQFINKNLKNCVAKHETQGYGHGWFIIFKKKPF